MISALNPDGYDDRQIVHISALQHNAAYSLQVQQEKKDHWASQDATMFAVTRSAPTYTTMNILSADTDKPFQPLRSTTRKILNPLSGSAVRQEQLNALIDIQIDIQKAIIRFRFGNGHVDS